MDIKSKFEIIVSRLCTALLGLLGYNCSSIIEPVEMYGTPYSTFEIKGTVKNQYGKPVEDAVIKLSEPWAPSDIGTFARTVTNHEGFYETTETHFSYDSLKIVCIPTGNSYLPDSTKVRLELNYDSDHPKSDWYFGHATLTVDFILRGNPEK